MRRPALVRCFENGRPPLHNYPAERALRSVAAGRKIFLSAGSDRGGERAPAMHSQIETAMLIDLDPEVYLRNVLARIADQPINRLAKLLPWN